MQNKKIELNDKQSNTSPSSAKGSTKKTLDKIEINPKLVTPPKSMYERTDDAVAETTISELVAEMQQQLSSEGLLDEAVLNLQQRLKRRTIMRQYKTKIAQAKERAQRKMADQPHLVRRAEKAARNIARKRFAGQRGVQYQELSPSDKIAVDKLVDKKGALIKKIASRLLPVIRKKEIQRLASFRSGEALKPEHTPANLMKEDDMMTFAEAVAPRKRGRPASAATLAKRDAAPKNKKMDDEDEYGPDNGREPDQNIIMQLHKAISMDGKKEVNFDQGGNAFVKPKHAEKALSHYNSLKKPSEKLDFIKKISTSHSHLKQAINEDADLFAIIENVMDRIDEDSMLSEEVVTGLKKKAEKSGMPLAVLKKVYKRGMSSYKSGLREDTTQQQWAFARVNSFIAGGKTTVTSDADLWEKVNEACWDGYKQVGTKNKGGKQVPNCVPVKEAKTPQEKFKAGLKKSGYDPDAGAKRLTDLIAKQKAERAEHEKKYGHLYAKEDAQLEQAPVAPALTKHRIAVTVSEPDHPMVSKRDEKILKHVIISHGPNKESAQKLGEKFYKKKGYKVHGSEHTGIREEVELDEAAVPGLAEKSKKSGVSLSTLRTVYKRGVAAWNSGHRPGTTPQQWGMARVNSYITKGKGTYGGADKDLREETAAVKSLESSLKKPTSYDAIDQMMKTIAKDSGISPKELHTQFVKKHGKTPDEYAKTPTSDKGLSEESITESGGKVVWKKGSNHIEKYSDDAYALYVDGKKQKFFTSIEAAKSAINLGEGVAKDKASGLSKKYVAGLSSSTAKARAAHFAKADKLSDRDPRAYEPAPGDATAKTKESVHTKKYKEMYGEAIDKEHPIVKEYDALKKNDIKTLRSLVGRQSRVSDTSEYRTKDHAITTYLRNKHGNKKVAQAFGLKEEVELDEASSAANLKAALSRHSEMAIAANKAGDDAAVKAHQVKMNAIKNKMAKMAKEEVTEAGVMKNFKRFVTGKLPSNRASAEGEKMIDAHSAGDKEAMMKHAKRAEKFDRLTNKPVNEDAASHLRTAAALQAKGKPQLASIHKKIAIALSRGDTTTARGYGKELSRVKSSLSMKKESIDEAIQYQVIDYSNMKPVAAPTMVEMKEYMPSIQAGFEHHPSVAKLLSIKEMRAQQKLTVKNQTRDNMENDPEDQIFAGSYRTQHFEVSPEAQKLYMNLPKEVDPNVAAVSATAHDKLFHIYKKVAASDFATPEDIATAKTHASHIMKFAKSMNLEKEHGYINDIMRQITDAKVDEVERPPSDNLADDPRFQSLPKDVKQEVGPGNDKDIDNLKNYKISRNLKAQRKLKIIDND